MTSNPQDSAIQHMSDPAVIRTRIEHLDPDAIKALKDTEALIAKAANSKQNEKEAKQVARKIVTAANQVINVVEGVAELHPVAKSVVTVFKALIKLELDRRDNNEQIAVVSHAMTSLMYSLRYLAQVIDEQDDFTNSLYESLSRIEEVMKEFGNFANLYYKYKQSIIRICRSASYKSQLDDFFKRFMREKDSLRELLSYRVMIATHDIHGQVSSLSINVDKIIDMLGEANAKEQQATRMIDQRGGPEAVIENDAWLGEVAKLLGEKLSGPVKSVLRDDLDHLLQVNHVQFILKLDGATMQITEAVERSRDAILRRLDAGPHELIEDEDVKKVWKDMNWRTSVKCRVFVDALHDYYELKIRKSTQDTGVTHPDNWCLQFLSKVMYHPAIGDAIDEDGSGFISVHETNHFLKRRPTGWSVPQWLAFWSIVWPDNNLVYYEKIDELIDGIKSTAKTTKPTNRENVDSYLTILDFVQPIILDSMAEGFAQNDHDDIDTEELTQLQDDYMKDEQERIREGLQQTDFYLEEESMLIAVTKQERIELSIMALLFVLLENHQKVITDARSKDVPEDTFIKMTETLLAVFFTFDSRMSDLTRGWKQQRKDVSLQVQFFAGGLYYGWYQETRKPHNAGERLQKLMGIEEDDEDDEDTDKDEQPDKMEQLFQRMVSLEAKFDLLLQTFASSGSKQVNGTHGAGSGDNELAQGRPGRAAGGGNRNVSQARGDGEHHYEENEPVERGGYQGGESYSQSYQEPVDSGEDERGQSYGNDSDEQAGEREDQEDEDEDQNDGEGPRALKRGTVISRFEIGLRPTP